MDYEVLRILAQKEDIRIIKNIFSNFEKLYPNMKTASKKIAQLSDRVVVTIKLEKSDYGKIAEAMILSGLKVVAVNDFTKSVIDSIKQKIQNNLKAEEEEAKLTKEDVNPQIAPISDEQLDELARDGNYQEIKILSKDIINFSENFVKKVKDLLTIAVENAINDAILVSRKSDEIAIESVRKLLDIASDTTLRSFNMFEIRQKAGIEAIEICLRNYRILTLLIDIANKANIPCNVNIQAIVSLSEIVLEDKEFFEKELEFAINNLNVRFIEISYDVAMERLTSDQLNLFNKFIEYIKLKKKYLE